PSRTVRRGRGAVGPARHAPGRPRRVPPARGRVRARNGDDDRRGQAGVADRRDPGGDDAPSDRPEPSRIRPSRDAGGGHLAGRAPQAGGIAMTTWWRLYGLALASGMIAFLIAWCYPGSFRAPIGTNYSGQRLPITLGIAFT